MCRFLPVLLLLCCIVNGIDSTTIRQFYMGKDCGSYGTHFVSEHDVYEIIWNDQTVPFSECEIEFKGRDLDGGSLDKYKICVNASEFVVKDCNVKVNYKLNSDLAKTFSCNDYPPTVCSGTGENFEVQLKENDRSFWENFYPGSKFKLIVTAVKTYDNKEKEGNEEDMNTGDVETYRDLYIYYIVVGVLVPLIVCIVAAVVFICICKQKRSSSNGGHVFYSEQSGHTNLAMTSVAVTNSGQSLLLSAYPQQTYLTQQYPTQQYPEQQCSPQTSVATFEQQGEQANCVTYSST